MCTWTIDKNWNEVQRQLSRHDVLKISSLLSLDDEESEIREKLEYCRSMGVQISLKGTVLDEDIYMDILQLLLQDKENRKKKLKAAQKKGIDRALQLNKEGKGNKYGRPPATLPDNFEEQIRYCRKYQIALEKYREKTDIKKSTFYKYAKQIK